MTRPTANVHASALVLDNRGVIIFGVAGSGKSSLTLELLHQAKRDGIAACLIADDRVDLRNFDGALVASPPASLAGLVEIRGSGIHRIGFEASATLHLAVELVTESQAQRLAPPDAKMIAHGLALPILLLPCNNSGAGVRAILSHLGLYLPLGVHK